MKTSGYKKWVISMCGRGMCEILPFARAHLWPWRVSVCGRKEAWNNSITLQNGCSQSTSVWVWGGLSVMCNKVSFYRPASTSGQLLVTPQPQSQPQPQKHNSCPSCPPPSSTLFQLQQQQQLAGKCGPENWKHYSGRAQCCFWPTEFLGKSSAIVVALQLSEEAH